MNLTLLCVWILVLSAATCAVESTRNVNPQPAPWRSALAVVHPDSGNLQGREKSPRESSDRRSAGREPAAPKCYACVPSASS